MKKIIYILVFIIVLSIFSVCFAEVPEVNRDIRVYDYANLLEDYEESSLKNSINEYIELSNFGMGIVTINENSEGSAMVYADDFVDKNNLGFGDKYDCILFLIDMDNREIYISTGGNAIIIYDDERIDKILDACYERISNGDYYGCCQTFINKAAYYFDQGKPDSNLDYLITDDQKYITIEEANTPTSFLYYLNPFESHRWVIISVVALLTGLLFTNAVRVHQKTVKTATSANNYVCNTDWVVKTDVLIGQNTTSRYIPPPDTTTRSGGGHHYGGSSTHHSSSGRIHGGGGRHF